MKRYSIVAGSLTLGLCAALLAAAAATAQDKPVRNRERAGKLDDKTTGANIRASQLIGMNIYNAKGESVGEVEDLVLDANTGRVRYAAVTYGGFLGLGDKLFAVPFEAFECRQDREDRDEYHLILNVTQQQLEGAQGFDQDHWPNFADRDFTRELDQRYNIRRRPRDGRKVDVEVDINRRGDDVDRKRRDDN